MTDTLKQAFEKFLNVGAIGYLTSDLKPEIIVNKNNVSIKCQVIDDYSEEENRFMRTDYLLMVADKLSEIEIARNIKKPEGEINLEHEHNNLYANFHEDTLDALSLIHMFSNNCRINSEKSKNNNSIHDDIFTLEISLLDKKQEVINNLNKYATSTHIQYMARSVESDDVLTGIENKDLIDGRLNRAETKYGNNDDIKIVTNYLESFIEKYCPSSYPFFDYEKPLEFKPNLSGTERLAEISFTVTDEHFNYHAFIKGLKQTFTGLDAVVPNIENYEDANLAIGNSIGASVSFEVYGNPARLVGDIERNDAPNFPKGFFQKQ